MLPVRAYHLIMTFYGFWLPNDPRGSWSDFVRAWELFIYGGRATRTDERQSLARTRHDIKRRLLVKAHLARAAVCLTGVQARAVGRGFADYARRSGCVIHACSILPRHVHLVVARHTCPIEQVANLMKGAATAELLAERLHPFADAPYANGRLPSPWARKKWDRFLGPDADIRRSIRYVENNPAKEGMAAQGWSFVTPLGE